MIQESLKALCAAVPCSAEREEPQGDEAPTEGGPESYWLSLTPSEKYKLLYRKLMFLEINELLKTEGLAQRYKRPISLEGFSRDLTTGFNVFLSRAVKSVLERFFSNLTRAGVLASPLPLSNYKQMSSDEWYENSDLCPLNSFPYRTFPPEILPGLQTSGFGALASSQVDELFQNILTFSEPGEEFQTLLARADQDPDPETSPGTLLGRDERIDTAFRYHVSSQSSPPFHSPMLLYSVKKERMSHCFILNFCVRDTEYYKWLCQNWSLIWSASPSPFVSYSFHEETLPGVAGIHWIVVAVDYSYILPDGGFLAPQIAGRSPPFTFKSFLNFFQNIQDFFINTFRDYYKDRWFQSSAFGRGLRFSGRGGSGPWRTLGGPLSAYLAKKLDQPPEAPPPTQPWHSLRLYLADLEPFLTLTKFVNRSLLCSDSSRSIRHSRLRALAGEENEDGAPIFPHLIEIATTHKTFLSSQVAQDYYQTNLLLDFNTVPCKLAPNLSGSGESSKDEMEVEPEPSTCSAVTASTPLPVGLLGPHPSSGPPWASASQLFVTSTTETLEEIALIDSSLLTATTVGTLNLLSSQAASNDVAGDPSNDEILF